jgi:hypothetical protein
MFLFQEEIGKMICRERLDPPHIHVIMRVTTLVNGTFYRIIPFDISGILISARLYSQPISGPQPPLVIPILYDRWGNQLLKPTPTVALGSEARVTIANPVDANITKPIVTGGKHSLYVSVLKSSGPYYATFELTYIPDYSARTRSRLW